MSVETINNKLNDSTRFSVKFATQRFPHGRITGTFFLSKRGVHSSPILSLLHRCACGNKRLAMDTKRNVEHSVLKIQCSRAHVKFA
jgi:hypothetical protein